MRRSWSLDAVLARTERYGDCRIWNGHLDKSGYAKIGKYLAHRAVYELSNGDIPNGFDIDHKCWNRACIEPEHLRALPARLNRHAQRSSLKTHCKRGHEFTEANTLIRKVGYRCRSCRQCANDAAKRYKDRKRAKT